MPPSGQRKARRTSSVESDLRTVREPNRYRIAKPEE
jgi:hypothetical protein